jgi:hypothetical protein
VLCESILLLDVVNNNSKFPFVEKKNLKSKNDRFQIFLRKEKKRKENHKTINSPLIFQKLKEHVIFIFKKIDKYSQVSE